MAGRAESDVRLRLQTAALELFRERGYDRTTAAGIAQRAGVTERTFFRHFPDKREALFDGEARLRALLTESIAEAPTDLPPLDVLFGAFRAVVPTLHANRAFGQPRYEIIAATPALRERELAKTVALGDALAQSLRARGVSDLSAELAARAGMAAFVQATVAWLIDPVPPLAERLDAAERELRALITPVGR